MKKKQTWIILLSVLIAGLAFYLGRNSVPKDYNLYGLYRQKYSGQFTSKHFPIGNLLVSYVYSSRPQLYDDSIGDIDKNATPRLVIEDQNYKIQALYEVSFTNAGEVEMGNLIYLKNLEVKNNFLVGEWAISWGGSSGLKGLVLLEVKDGELQPITGYPFDFTKDYSINLTNALTGKKYSFPIDIDSVFSEVTDLNKDGKLDLLYANYKWDEEKGEGHYQARPWNLQVFELIDNKFTVTKWWNKGEVYKTPENIGYNDADTFKLRQIFTDKAKQ